MSERKTVVVSDDQKPIRIDTYLAKEFADLYSRMTIKRWVKSERILVNGAPVKHHYEVSPGDTIIVMPEPPPVDYDRAEDIPIEVVYEDDDLLVVNKAAGMVVHPGVGNMKGTLVNALLHHVKQLSSSAGNDRPGIVHRLDKDTSGLLVVAKNDWTHERLAAQFRARTAKRIYQCIVKGVVQHDEGCFTEPIGRSNTEMHKMRVDPLVGKAAVTNFTVRKRFKRNTCLDVKLSTGRTHQIRVHMAYHGHPIVGDPDYGVKSSHIKRQALHAGSLEFIHPRTEKSLLLHAPLPSDFQRLLDHLNSEDNR